MEIKRDPRVVEALNKLGLLLPDKGDVDKALSVFRKSLDLASGDPAVLNDLSMALNKKAVLVSLIWETGRSQPLTEPREQSRPARGTAPLLAERKS